MALASWFAGWLGLIVAAAVASSRGRAMPNDVARRGLIAIAAAAYTALIAAAVWTWGGSTAIEGRAQRLHDGARASVTVRAVAFPLGKLIAIGRGDGAAIQLPGAGAAEVARIEVGSDGAVVRASDAKPPKTAEPAPIDPYAEVTSGVIAGGEAAASARKCSFDREASLPPGSVVTVVECDGGKPLRAIAIHRDRWKDELAITPLVWHGKLTPERLVVRAGDVVRLGGGDALPGVTTWDVAAKTGSTAIVAVPADPTDCAAWSIDPAASRASADGCVVTTGAFELAALPLVPDADAVVARASRAAFAIGAPVLLLLAGLVLAPRRGRRAHAVGRALRLGVVAAGLTALVCWRLLWSYRIDVMRELSASGFRVLDNRIAAAAIGAALAGNVALAALAGRSAVRRGAAAIAAWAAWLACGWLAIGMPALAGARTAGVLALSLVGALLPLLGEVADRARKRLDDPGIALVAIAIGSIAGRALEPRSALCKLALAYATVLAAHAALRVMLGRDASLLRRAWLAAALGAATLTLATYDTGVALVIAGTGLALAAAVAGHDAAYDASQAGRIGILEREHARLILVHGVAAIAISITVAVYAFAVDDRTLVESGALAVLFAPLVMAALFAISAIVARSHRRGWVPWLAAALAALAIWGARDSLLDRVTDGHGVGSRRVSAVIEPGFALLRDQRAFAASASAWREAALAPGDDLDPWHGQGYFGARLRDPGVIHSVDNDYLAVLIAREAGAGGLAQGAVLLLAFAIGAGAIASARLRHASREHRARWLITAVIAATAVYQPVASLGVFPLTGISWPGLGVDSPADLWLFALGAIWCVMGGGEGGEDERVRRTPRLARARTIAIVALAIAGAAALAIVIRAGTCALGRAANEDTRIDDALAYVGSIACPWQDRDGATAAEVVPDALVTAPRDASTARFDRELRAAWTADRPRIVDALPACKGTAGHWQLAREGELCTATFRDGWPAIRLQVHGAFHASCVVPRDDDAIAQLRPAPHGEAHARIRVVSAPIGVAAEDLGELVLGSRVVRFRPGAAALDLATVTAGAHASASVTIAPGVALDVRPAPPAVVLHGAAELYVAAADTARWQRLRYTGAIALDRVTLIVAGGRVVLFRPPRAWAGATPTVDPLLADDTVHAGDPRVRRDYPYGSALPELGWVNPFEREHSLGLDGWIHAALAHAASAAPSCGTLSPPAIPRDRVCTASPLDGVMECRVALQPELAATLRDLAGGLLVPDKGHAAPVRAAYVVLRGDTGELLAQGNVAAGRPPLVYAPADAAAEAELVRLRGQAGEADSERVEWNLPIAVGSTFKPIVARAAERAFPDMIAQLTLTADGHGGGCKGKRGEVEPILGHCPPTSLASTPTAADFHEFLAHSPNWYQAALGLLGLGLPSAQLSVSGQPVSFTEVIATDLASWPADKPLTIADGLGPILTPNTVVVDGVRRTPLWKQVEALLGRPLCTLGDHAKCERAGARADVCSARALPIASPTADLRYLVALGPDRIDLYSSDREHQAAVPAREYFQLLRGAGVHPLGSLAQIADAFGRVIYDASATPRLAASWFPAPAVGTVPSYSCTAGGGHANTVLGADGGLCAVVQPGGTASKLLGELLTDPNVVIYGAKTGTTDSLAEVARHPEACRAWNDTHVPAAQLECGKTPPDDSLFVIAFGVVTPHGTIPITLGIQLQRAGKGSATRAAPAFAKAIERYVRGA